MAKEVAIEKRAKITEAREYMLASVFGAAVFMGVALALVIHFFQLISFNADVISVEDQSIVNYSKAIKQTGICKSPKGDVYTDEELKKCDPDSIDIKDIPGTLRAKILEELAADDALNSVPKEDDENCINPDTQRNYNYSELNKIYDAAKTSNELSAASKLIKTCSALRVVPDALPAFRNEEALLASLNKIFIISGWEPESLSPSGTNNISNGTNLHNLSVSLSIEADSFTTLNVLSNIERSIRSFDISHATIKWDNKGLSLHAQATAYYMDEATLKESTKTIKVGGKK